MLKFNKNFLLSNVFAGILFPATYGLNTTAIGWILPFGLLFVRT
jgi:hypothetical protein